MATQILRVKYTPMSYFNSIVSVFQLAKGMVDYIGSGNLKMVGDRGIVSRWRTIRSLIGRAECRPYAMRSKWVWRVRPSWFDFEHNVFEFVFLVVTLVHIIISIVYTSDVKVDMVRSYCIPYLVLRTATLVQSHQALFQRRGRHCENISVPWRTITSQRSRW